MKMRISAVTLGVDDLEASLRFYRALGFTTEGVIGTEMEHGAVVFFDMAGGLKLALYERKNLAWDATLPQGPRSPAEISLAHNVASREEVDAVLAEAKRAGATIVKPASETFWGGYAGYFQDPDGHLWEVAHNAAWKIQE